MAVHLPLGEDILEASDINVGFSQYFEPCKRSPITVPSQDMVLGLYYMTKPRKSTEDFPVKEEV